MTDIPTETVQSVPAKKRWRWWQIALAIVGGLVILSLLGGSPDLKVSLNRNGEIQIQNVGRKAVDIQGVRVNDRSDCKVVSMLNLGNPDANVWPVRLEVGNGIGLIPFCSAVRIAVDTSAGSSTYTFNK